MQECLAVCCIVLHCDAVCCSVLQCAAVCCSALQCVAVRCRVVKCLDACKNVLSQECLVTRHSGIPHLSLFLFPSISFSLTHSLSLPCFLLFSSLLPAACDKASSVFFCRTGSCSLANSITCVYIYICICIYICIYIYVYVYIYIYICILKYIYIYVYVHMHVHMCVCEMGKGK